MPIAEAMQSLVAAVEKQSTAGPAVKAFQAAIRRNAEEAAEAGGREAMEAAPDGAERRENIIDKA